MEATPHQQALQQLASIPGVVGSMVFGGGAVVASAFPPVFDADGLRQLGARLTADSYFHEWMIGEEAALDLRYLDGHVVVRSLDGAFLLVLCTVEANSQLLSMSLTQVVRRLRAGGATRTGGVPLASPAPPAAEPSPLERMRAVVQAELGEHATKALEILAAAGSKPKDLLRAAADVEKMTKLFIDRKKADEVGRKLREILGK